MTAEDFLKGFNEEQGNIDTLYYDEYVQKVMRGFAKMHVREALYQASNKAAISVNLRDFIEDSWESGDKIEKDSILNSYPLENIK